MEGIGCEVTERVVFIIEAGEELVEDRMSAVNNFQVAAVVFAHFRSDVGLSKGEAGKSAFEIDLCDAIGNGTDRLSLRQNWFK